MTPEPSRDERHCAEARELIARLMQSERGAAALYALHEFLQEDASYSLDFSNQTAVAGLLQRAWMTPSVREVIAEQFARPAGADPDRQP